MAPDLIVPLNDDERVALECEARIWGTTAERYAQRVLMAHLARPIESRLPPTFVDNGRAS